MNRRQLLDRSLALAGASALTGLLVPDSVAAAGSEWPQWRGPGRDGVWNETGLIERFARPRLDAKWRAPVGNGYTGPTVAGGRVYLTDHVAEPAEMERVHCFDAATGTRAWTHAYPTAYKGIGYADGPRASVTLHDGLAYALGAMGQLCCLDAAKGTVVWQKDLNAEYRIRTATWGVAAAPLIEGDLVITHIGGSDNACLVAFDRRTGQEKWRALPDPASYVSPITINQSGKRVTVVWTGERVVGLDPMTGKLYWEVPFPAANKIIIAIATPVFDRDRLFLSSFYDGSMMLKVRQDQAAVEKIWQRRGPNERQTDGLQGIISTAVLDGDYVYGVDSYGELRCLDAKTGERIWEDLRAVPKARWSTIHFVRNGDRYWLFNERGQLIIARLSPNGYEEISRADLIRPTTGQLPERGGVCWSHPAFAYQSVFARNDEELVCASLKA